MKFTILVPHYKQGQATAYAVHQLHKHKGKHEIDVIVIDNSRDESINHILSTELKSLCRVLVYPGDRLQSHGIAFDYALKKGLITTDHFITIESDSFPTRDTWLDDYSQLAKNGVKCVGSLLPLSGGQYIHPCGAMYNTSVWNEAYWYCENFPYFYFPNMVLKENFECHTMVRKSKFEDFIRDFGNGHRYQPSPGYDGITVERMFEKEGWYSPTKGPFHNGMGANQESIRTYGQRSIYTAYEDMREDKLDDVILRIGYEPGQWFCYWMLSHGFQLAKFKTEVKWLHGRENQNQEYTMTETGFVHLWGVSSFHKSEDPKMKDVIEFKSKQMTDLYDSLPSNCRL